MKMLPPQVVVDVDVDRRTGADRRRRGRPTINGDGASPSEQVHLRVPNDDYDAACELARLDRVELNDVFRRAIRAHVREELAKRATK